MMSTPRLMVRCLASTRVIGTSPENGHNEELDHRDGTEETENVERDEIQEGDTVKLNEAVGSSQHEDSYSLLNDRASNSVTPSASIHSDSESVSSVVSSNNSALIQSVGSISCIQEAQLSPD